MELNSVPILVLETKKVTIVASYLRPKGKPTFRRLELLLFSALLVACTVQFYLTLEFGTCFVIKNLMIVIVGRINF